ncbi:class I SAM-dependent methyltransferase [Streptomyces profundus]|uniref:class I SAM-dependent methyltransferase n=1 Tax=Streptomyces profundus TaxID=2867410 RepID=UPI001D169648|nr:class I SAM-dependent methyltransferase [Streptomyces sp. MA3_2.13]UED85648.1 class I SAM-dependent methyltransferase [Streptomyces sp. MA3_2.13]
MRTTDFASSFNAVAAEYAAARPDYPPHHYDTIEELLGRPLTGLRVLDVGAGTGKATRALLDRGARVTAVEPGAEMAAQLRAANRDATLVRGNGDALPFADSSVDLITYAQAWHWTRPEVALPEALRVLRGGGALALWWNRPDRTVAWVDEQAARLTKALPSHHVGDITRTVADHLTALEPALRPVYRETSWQRTVPLATHLKNLATHSSFAVLDPEQSRPVLAREAEILGALFPEGRIVEPYTVRLTYLPRPERPTPRGE